MKNLKKMYSQIEKDDFPNKLTITLGNQQLIYRKREWTLDNEKKGLRYGENPGQPAALYQLEKNDLNLNGINWVKSQDALVSALNEKQLLNVGKHPGKTNLTDIDNGINILKYLTERPACVILKHNNPCGAAWSKKEAGGLETAMTKALNCDLVAAFGGAIVVNEGLSKTCAELVASNYFEVLAAPYFEEGTVGILAQRKNLRIMELPALANLADLAEKSFLDIKSLSDGGLIVQKSWQNAIKSEADFLPAVAETKNGAIVAARRPTRSELDDLRFGWAVEGAVSSNSVIFVKDGATIAIGAGEQDRVGCVEIAIFKAYSRFADRLARQESGFTLYELRQKSRTSPELKDKLLEMEKRVKSAKGGLINSCLVSDGFFPFRDGVDAAIEQGVSAIAQPGGSLRDAEVIEACNEASPQVGMVFTGQRSFRH